MLKKLSLFFATLFIGITAFLIIPTSFSTTKIDFPKEEPIKLIPNEQNKGERCKAEIYYVTEKTIETHEKEGYEFTVNDYCANLQENLIKAIQNKNPVEVKRLISLGANPQGVDFSGFDTRHPLYIASFGETEIAKILLDNNADVNKEFCCCASCVFSLVNAINSQNPQMVKLLIERGANINYTPSNADYFTIPQVATEKGNQEIITILENACQNDLVCRAKFRVSRILGLFSRLDQPTN